MFPRCDFAVNALFGALLVERRQISPDVTPWRTPEPGDGRLRLGEVRLDASSTTIGCSSIDLDEGKLVCARNAGHSSRAQLAAQAPVVTVESDDSAATMSRFTAGSASA
jgi:hypothetical protein